MLSDRLMLLLLALAVKALFCLPARMQGNAHFLSPGAAWDRLVRALESKFNRNWRSAGDLRMRGIILTLLLVGIAWMAGLWLGRFSAAFSYGAALDVALLCLLLPVRRLFSEAQSVSAALETGALDTARRQLRGIAQRNIGQLDMHASARAAIESLMENFSLRLLSPLFYYALFGIPGICIAVAVTRTSRVFSTRAPHLAAFGWMAGMLDYTLHYIPARLGACVIMLAALLVPKGNAPRALGLMLKDGPRFRFPNIGWPVAATAGALGLALGGPRSLHLTYFDDPWTGSGSVQATPRDLRRALYLYVMSVGVLSFLLLLLRYYAPVGV